LEFALHGADVVAIEGRAANIAKAEFAVRAYGLRNVELIHGDVRSLSKATHGSFDLIICSGILYHLPAVDAWKFIQSMYETCDCAVLIDTFIALSSQTMVSIDGFECHGLIYPEHDNTETSHEIGRKLWASLDNLTSFWFTEPTLMNLLRRAGFTTCFDVLTPNVGHGRDRKTYCAVKSKAVKILSSDLTDVQEPINIPEGVNPLYDAVQQPRSKSFQFGKKMLPPAVKDAIKPALRRFGLLPPDTTPEFMRKRNRDRTDR
jgi:Methyltransferase domain